MKEDKVITCIWTVFLWCILMGVMCIKKGLLQSVNDTNCAFSVASRLDLRMFVCVCVSPCVYDHV